MQTAHLASLFGVKYYLILVPFIFTKIIIMTFDDIKQSTLTLDAAQQVHIKGGTNDANTTTSIVGIDIDAV